LHATKNEACCKNKFSSQLHSTDIRETPGIIFRAFFLDVVQTARIIRSYKKKLISAISKEGYDMARVALVTGGTRGIGAAISKALKSAGYKVAASYAGNDAAAEKFKAETGIPVYKWDVSSFDACTVGVKQVEADVGPVDVLVNNAGITKDTAFHKMTLDQWTAVINTNLGSLFNMTRPVIEGMRSRKFGRIINISSINGQKGQFGQVNYSAAKAGDIGFTKALALENAKGGITVNVICPGYINTEMVQAVPKDVLEKNVIPQIPVNRLGEPEEIARAVVFLAADDAGFITGSTLTVNGGQYHA
jgi:acetoacetyl-CoA reductase